MNCLFLNPPMRNATIMVKEGRCMQRKGAWGYIMSPVTMVTLATLLHSKGHSVTVMDCPADGTAFPAMLETVNHLSPDIVYINTSTPTIADDLHAARCIKLRAPAPPMTVLFGIHPSNRYAELLEDGADCCIIGEPEMTALELADAIACGTSLHQVAGIAFHDNSELITTRQREFLVNLDDLPVPDWSLIDTENYRLPFNNKRFLLVNTNRGCPYSCTFCNAHTYYGRHHRHRSVSHIMHELRNNVEQFGVTDFMFWAEEFILDKAFVHALCKEIVASGLSVNWVCNSRVDAVDREVLTSIRRAGCWNIAFGIESGVQDILDHTNKGISLHQIVAAVEMAKDAGLHVTGHVIIGLPNDSRDSIAQTERFIDSLDLDFVQYYCAMPYPGTELYREAQKHGWLTTTDWKQWEHNRSVLTYNHLTAAEIMQLRRKMMLRWYLTPKRIIRTLKNHVRQPSDFLAILSRFGGFLRWM